MNKITIIITFFLILGCSSKKKLIEKELIGAKVERISEVKKTVKKNDVKDSVIQKKEVKTSTDQSTDLHIEFDPKKNDSLEVLHMNGLDSIYFKAQGNGIVILNFKKKKQVVQEENHQIFGSKTLYNIDSTVSEKKKEDIQIKVEKSTKQKKEIGFELPVYFIVGGAVLLMIVLFVLWKKFGGGIVDRFKNGKIKF